MSNTLFNLHALIEAIEKIELYTAEFMDADAFYHDQKSFDADEIWDIIKNKIVPLKQNLVKLL